VSAPPPPHTHTQIAALVHELTALKNIINSQQAQLAQEQMERTELNNELEHAIESKFLALKAVCPPGTHFQKVFSITCLYKETKYF
jgi:hypothetical protein